MQSLAIPSTIPSGAADAALLADIEAVRASIAATGILCIAEDTRTPAESQFWDDMLALMAPLPADVLIIRTVLGDADPVPAPNVTRVSHSPGTEATERRTGGPPEPAPAPVTDALTLERVMRMARRRQLKAYHTGEHIAFTDPAGETKYSGTIAEVYEALKQDTLAKMPPTPQQELRERLARYTGWGGPWTLQDDGPDRYTLCRGDPPERYYTGTLEQMELVAASRILNSTINLGYPE